jgi:hypothetical protein
VLSAVINTPSRTAPFTPNNFSDTDA